MHARKIVTTVDASMAVEDAGFTTVRTKVGDTFVSEELRKGGEFGGEPSGAWIFPQSSLCPDGIYAAAAFVSLASQTKISTLVDNIPQYPIVRGSIPNSSIAFPDIMRSLSTLGAVKTDDSDGFKLIFNDSWLLCRASGTEPKIRITTEARNETRARQLYESALETIRNMSKTKR
jgi:phosphoglucosamine mutase